MSKRLPVNRLGQIRLENAIGEYVGTFQSLQCEQHGNALHYTDQTGSDNCTICVKSELKRSKE